MAFSLPIQPLLPEKTQTDPDGPELTQTYSNCIVPHLTIYSLAAFSMNTFGHFILLYISYQALNYCLVWHCLEHFQFYPRI